MGKGVPVTSRPTFARLQSIRLLLLLSVLLLLTLPYGASAQGNAVPPQSGLDYSVPIGAGHRRRPIQTNRALVIATPLGPLNATDAETFGYPAMGSTRGRFAGSVLHHDTIIAVPDHANAFVAFNWERRLVARTAPWAPAYVSRAQPAFFGGAAAAFGFDSYWPVPRRLDATVLGVPFAFPDQAAFNNASVNEGTGTDRWVGSCFDGRFIWMPPFRAKKALRIDPGTGTIHHWDAWPDASVAAAVQTATNLFASCSFQDERYIVFAPFTFPLGVVRIDTFNISASVVVPLPVTLPHQVQFITSSVGCAGTARIVYAPGRADAVLVSVNTTHTAEFRDWPDALLPMPSTPDKFFGAVWDGRRAWIGPGLVEAILGIDPATGAMVAFSKLPKQRFLTAIPLAGPLWKGIAYDGSRLWLTPHRGRNFVAVSMLATRNGDGYGASAAVDSRPIRGAASDVVIESHHQLHSGGNPSSIASFGASCFDGRRTWLAPFYAADITVVDADGNATTVPWPHNAPPRPAGVGLFRACAFDGAETVWLAPFRYSAFIAINVTDATTRLTYDLGGSSKSVVGNYHGAAFDGQYVYFAAFGQHDSVRIDVNSSVRQSITHNEAVEPRFESVCVRAPGSVLFIPARGGVDVEELLGSATATVEVAGTGLGTASVTGPHGGCISATDYGAFIVPRQRSSLTGFAENATTASSAVRDRFANITQGSAFNTTTGGAFDGEYLWLPPRLGGTDAGPPAVTRIHVISGVTTTFAVDVPPLTLSKGAYGSGWFDGYRVWFAPIDHDGAASNTSTHSNRLPLLSVRRSLKLVNQNGMSSSATPSDGSALRPIHPRTAVVRTFNVTTGLVLDSSSIFSGCAFDGTSVWFVPNAASFILRVDVTDAATGSATSRSLPLATAMPNAFGTDKLFEGIVFDGSEQLFFVPYSGRVIGIVNTTSESATTLPVPSADYNAQAFEGGCTDGQRIYFAPYDAPGIMIVDRDTHAITTLVDWPEYGCGALGPSTNHKFVGCVHDPDASAIWFIPFHAACFIKLRISDRSLFTFANWKSANHVFAAQDFRGGVLHKRHLWTVPRDKATVIRLNIDSGVMTSFAAATGSFPSTFNSGAGNLFFDAAYDGDSMWLVPRQGDRVVRVPVAAHEDTFPGGGSQTIAMEGYSEWPKGVTKQAASFSGGCFDGARVWLVPREVGALVTIENASDRVGVASVSPPSQDGISSSSAPVDAEASTVFELTPGARAVAFDRAETGVTGGFFTSAISAGGFTWFLPATSQQFLGVHQKTNQQRWVPMPGNATLHGTASFHGSGGCYDGHRFIYLTPAGLQQVVRLDVFEFTATALPWPSWAHSGYSFFGAHCDAATGDVIFLPSLLLWMVRFHPSDPVGTARNLSAGFPTAEFGAFATPDSFGIRFDFTGGIFARGRIWLVPHRAGRLTLVSYGVANGDYKTHGSLPGSAGSGLYSGGCFDGTHLHFPKNQAGGVVYSFNVFTERGNSTTTISGTYTGCVFDGRYVIFVPTHFATNLPALDTHADLTVVTLTPDFASAGVPTTRTSAVRQGGVFDGTRLWIAPTSGTAITVVEPKGWRSPSVTVSHSLAPGQRIRASDGFSDAGVVIAKPLSAKVKTSAIMMPSNSGYSCILPLRNIHAMLFVGLSGASNALTLYFPGNESFATVTFSTAEHPTLSTLRWAGAALMRTPSSETNVALTPYRENEPFIYISALNSTRPDNATIRTSAPVTGTNHVLGSTVAAGRFWGAPASGSAAYSAVPEAMSTTSALRTHPLPNAVVTPTTKFCGAVDDGNGHVWLVPFRYSDIVVIETGTGVTKVLVSLNTSVTGPAPTNGYFCGATVAKGRVWLAPYDALHLVDVAVGTLSISTTPWPSGFTASRQRKFYGSAFDGRYVWMSPRAAGVILRLDTVSRQSFALPLPSAIVSPSNYALSGALFDGTDIWMGTGINGMHAVRISSVPPTPTASLTPTLTPSRTLSVRFASTSITVSSNLSNSASFTRLGTGTPHATSQTATKRPTATVIGAPTRSATISLTRSPKRAKVDAPPASPVPVAADATATAVSTIAAITNPTMASQAGRVAAVRGVIECVDSGELDPPGFVQNPLGLSVELPGDDETSAGDVAAVRLHSGSVVGAVIITAGFAVVYLTVVVGGRYAYASRVLGKTAVHGATATRLARAMAWARFPGIVVFVAAYFTGFVAASSITVVFRGGLWAGVVIGIVGGLYAVVPWLAAVVYFASTFRTRYLLVAEAAEAAASRRSRRGPMRVVFWLFIPASDWTELCADLSSSAAGAAPTREAAKQTNLRRFGLFFNAYNSRAPWFLIAESLVLNVGASTALALADLHQCPAAAYVALAAYVVQLALVCVFRPFLMPAEAMGQVAGVVFQGLAIAIMVAQRTEGVSGGAALQDAAEWCATVAVLFVTFVGLLDIAVAVVQQVRLRVRRIATGAGAAAAGLDRDTAAQRLLVAGGDAAHDPDAIDTGLLPAPPARPRHPNATSTALTTDTDATTPHSLERPRTSPSAPPPPRRPPVNTVAAPDWSVLNQQSDRLLRDLYGGDGGGLVAGDAFRPLLAAAPAPRTAVAASQEPPTEVRPVSDGDEGTGVDGSLDDLLGSPAVELTPATARHADPAADAPSSFDDLLDML